MKGVAGAASKGMRAFFLPTILVVLSPLASAGDVQIPVAKRFTVGAASRISTTSFSPQIAPPKAGPERPENPVRPIPIGPPNSLISNKGWTNVNRVAAGPKFPGISNTGWQPPDCDVSVGPNHLVQVVNSSLAFFRKADGVKTFQQNFQDFFKGVGNQTDFLFDPKTFYDPLSKRFFVLALEMDSGQKISKLLLAVSDDADPTGAWFRYRVEAKGTFGSDEAWLDYPGFSSNKDSVLITGNMFGFTAGYYAVSFIVLPKQPLLAGSSANAVTFYDTSAFTAQPSRTSDAFLDRIYTVSSSYNTSTMQVHAITGLPSNPTVTSTTLSIPSFTPPMDYVRGPDGIILDAIDTRTFTSAYRSGNLVAAHNVSVSSSDRRIATRWYEVATKGWPSSGSTPSLLQSGTLVGASGEHLHMPAINVNRRGAISLLMTRTSASIMADVVVASRVKTDAPGTMSPPKKLGGSRAKAALSQNRWGDYFSVCVDPNDESTFWGNGEVFGSDGFWATEIVTWKVNDIDSATAFNLNTPTVMQGTYVRGTAGSLVAVDGNTYDVRTTAVANLGQTATWEAAVPTNLTPSTVDYMALRWTLSAPLAATQFVFAYNWSTGQYESLATRPAKSGNPETVEVTTSLAKFVRADGMVKVAVRAVQPIRNGIMPSAFGLKVDQLQVLAIRKS